MQSPVQDNAGLFDIARLHERQHQHIVDQFSLSTASAYSCHLRSKWLQQACTFGQAAISEGINRQAQLQVNKTRRGRILFSCMPKPTESQVKRWLVSRMSINQCHVEIGKCESGCLKVI